MLLYLNILYIFAYLYNHNPVCGDAGAKIVSIQKSSRHCPTVLGLWLEPKVANSPFGGLYDGVLSSFSPFLYNHTRTAN